VQATLYHFEMITTVAQIPNYLGKFWLILF